MAPIGLIARNRLLSVALGLAAVILIGVILIPTLDGPCSRSHANEAMAFARLRLVNSRQADYAATHSTGFACELRLLKSDPAGDHSDDYREDFLISGTHAGYRFEVVHCEADPNGRVTHYQIAAPPPKYGQVRLLGFLHPRIWRSLVRPRRNDPELLLIASDC